MKKLLINIILLLGFACLISIISVSLFAAIQFESAGKIIAQYRWKAAENYLESAMKTDPYNSQYPARFGEFLVTQAGYKYDQTALLKRASEYYGRASMLNPRCAEYIMKQGQISINLFIQGPAKKEYIDKAFNYFRKVVINDPNGFNAAYAIGYSGLAVWNSINESEKALVVDRLRFSLKQKPWYSEYIYSQILRETDNPELIESITPEVESRHWVDLQIIKKLKDDVILEKLANVIARSNWYGTSFDGGNFYENGNMNWSGTIYGAMLFPKGDALVKVEAKGSPADGVYPYMLISLDGKKIGSIYVGSSEFKEYTLAANTDGGIKILSATFTNDGGNKNEDRNLYIGTAKVEQK